MTISSTIPLSGTFTNKGGKDRKMSFTYASLAKSIVALAALRHITSDNLPEIANEHPITTMLKLAAPALNIPSNVVIEAALENCNKFVCIYGPALDAMSPGESEEFGDAFNNLVEHGGVVEFDDGSKLTVEALNLAKRAMPKVRVAKSPEDLMRIIAELGGFAVKTDGAESPSDQIADVLEHIHGKPSPVGDATDDKSSAAGPGKRQNATAHSVSLHGSKGNDGNVMIRVHHHDGSTTDAPLSAGDAQDIARAIFEATKGSK